MDKPDKEYTQKELNIPHKPHHFLSKKVAVLGIIFLLLALGALFSTYTLDTTKNSSHSPVPSPLITEEPSIAPEQEAVFCTMDAKICPDGSSVGRVPPSCEFAVCPTN